MPGIIGFVGKPDGFSEQQFIEKMAHALEPQPQFKSELYYDSRVGLGRVHLGILNPEKQPVWNESKTLCLVLDGEIYNHHSLEEDLIQRGHRFQSQDDAELVLHLYEEFGDSFAIRINGAFVAAIWNGVSRKLVVVNDRLGLYPLYYASYKGRFLFAGGVRALLSDPDLPRTVDVAAISQFHTFDHVLDDRTLLKEVHLMPQASFIFVEDGRYEIRPYWTIKYPEIYPLRPELDYAEELIHLLRQAVARQAQDERPKAVLLSGGLDSRFLAALLDEIPASWPLHTFTWGIPNCDDARYAREVARKTRAQHHFFELKADYLLSTAENAVRITDGLGNIVNLHALATLEEEVDFARVIYKGFMGDAMFGFALRQQFWADYDDNTTVQAHFQVHLDQGVIPFTPAQQADLFTDEMRSQVGNAVMENYRAGMLAAGSRSLAIQRLYFDLTQRVPRMTINGVEVVRNKAAVRLPYCDNDLVDFSLRVPPGLHNERRLVRYAFITHFPELARVPVSGTGLPMVENTRMLLKQGDRLLRWHLQKLGIDAHPDRLWRPYKDYNHWFRTVLREWVEDTLLSPRCLERGYYKPDSLKNLVAEHMAGKNIAGRIGSLMSVELWHRQFIDQRS